MSELKAYAHLKRLYPNAHWVRVESYASTGAFDTNACYDGSEVWVELKEAAMPLTTRGKVRTHAPVRSTQVAWEYIRRKAGGRTFVALYFAKEGRTVLLPGRCLATLRHGVTPKWLEENVISAAKLFS